VKAYKIGEGAYFAPSYSEQTVIPFQPAITDQTVITSELEEEIIQITPEAKEVFTKQDFESDLMKASKRIKRAKPSPKLP